MNYKDNKPADAGNNDRNFENARVIVDAQGSPELQQESTIRYVKEKLAPVDSLMQQLKEWASDESDIEEAERIAGRKLSDEEREDLHRFVMVVAGAPVILPDGEIPRAKLNLTHGSTQSIAKALYNQMSLAPGLAHIIIASAMYCFHKDENLEWITIESAIETMREFIRRHEGKEGGR